MARIPWVCGLIVLLTLPVASAAGASVSVVQEFHGNASGDQLGYAVSEAGDLNSDGYGDWAIGSPFSSPLGGVYVYFGSPAVGATPDLTLVKANSFGMDLDAAGDVNNSGYPEILARRGTWGGYVYVFYGGAPMDSIADKQLSTQPNCSDNCTADMDPAGDFNGDGYSDVLVGISGMFMPHWVELYYGSSGFNNKPDVFLGPGEQCAGGGNINGDAFNDIAVGEPFPWTGPGTVRIFLGSAAPDSYPDPSLILQSTAYGFGHRVSFAGDVNGDGFDDLLASCSARYDDGSDVYIYHCSPAMDTLPDLTIPSTGDTTGFGSVIEPLGDVNADGYDDVALGAPNELGGRGRVYIYLGGNPMDAVPDIILEGETTSDLYGFSVAGLGDVNGDSDVEFLVGAPGYEAGRGKAYMYAAARAGVGHPGDHLVGVPVLRVSPSPFTSQVTIAWSLPSPSCATVEAYDVAGRRVKTFIDEVMPAGAHTAIWNGLDDSGRPVSPGVYFIRLGLQGQQILSKVTLLR